MTESKKYTKFGFSAVLLASLLIMAVPLSTVAEEAAESNDIATKALIEKKCSTCHSIERAYEANKTHDEWERTVKKMTRYSDQMNFLNQKERKTIIDFLVKHKSAQANSEQ